MKRVLPLAATILLASVALVSGKVIAKDDPSQNQAKQLAAPPTPEALARYLTPIQMQGIPPGPPALTIDLPAKGTIYPPEIIAPQFAWRDDNPAAKEWSIEIDFAGREHPIKLWSGGDRFQLGPIDESLTDYVPPEPSPVQAAEHTWRPDATLWEQIKKLTVEKPATVVITGYRSENDNHPLFRGESTFLTSRDPVGAPLFFRDVPLMPRSPLESERELIKPLPTSALPFIKWQLRYISEPRSKVMMEGLETCANCHSFSVDGKTMGIDVDGPQNDKGLYALLPVKHVPSIANDYVLQWSSFADERAEKRFGFMSQVSPDGRFVLTSIDPPHSHRGRVLDRIYGGQFYSDYAFGQVFYPTRGVLAWYSKDTRKLTPLPGADDPNLVQAAGFWSPDGKYIVYCRAQAKDPYPPGVPRSTYANDPNETQIQYDLYRIPFNDGKGGVPERIEGASQNGMSNNFPKVSPDGKWIVFVQNRNGLLMRPDSKLYIVPFNGGQARPLESNLPIMNSWHTWSPNGHWLAFSSKSPSFYTHLYLTHIDAAGHASPPVVVENATASNRAVNIPEFVNIGPDGMDHIDTPAIDFFKVVDTAASLSEDRKYAEAIPVWKHALELNANDSRVHNDMGVALAALGRNEEAIAEYRRSLELNADSSQTHNNFASVLAETGRSDEALAEVEKAIQLNPDNGAAHVSRGHLLEERGGHRDEAIAELLKGIELAPKDPDGYNIYGVILARMGRTGEAVAELEKAVELAPNTVECHYNLGRVYAAAGRFSDALPQFETASRLAEGQEPAILQMLAAMYSEAGKYSQAIATAQTALDLASKRNDRDLAAALLGNINHYQYQARQAQVPAPAQP